MGYTIEGIDGVGTLGVYVHSSTSLTNVTVKNLRVIDWDNGILYSTVINGKIANITVISNYYGISLFSGNNNIINNNTASSNEHYGIYIGSSNNNTLTDNIVTSNNGPQGTGINLDYSRNNTINNNTVISNNYDGITIAGSDDNTLINNIVSFNSNNGINLTLSSNGNHLYNNTASSNNKDGILLSYSHYNSLGGNIANSNNYNGTFLFYSDNNTLNTNNNNLNSLRGITLFGSSNNKLSGNTVKSNNFNGVWLYISNNNSFYNNIFNNTNNIAIYSSITIWNFTKTSSTNIIGGPFLGGNFWANPLGTGFSQNCSDADRDGICNSNYTLASGNIDYLPLSLNFTISNPLPATSIGYSALVATGQNTFVQSSNGSFGLLLKGQSKTLNNSVILNNTGDLPANVEARFNDSIGGVFGLVSGVNVLNATNFALGIPSALVPLSSLGADVQVVVAPPGMTALDARLAVPNEQAAGDYQGTVVLTFSNNV
jgi:parallel beta-helix repeat protein